MKCLFNSSVFRQTKHLFLHKRSNNLALMSLLPSNAFFHRHGISTLLSRLRRWKITHYLRIDTANRKRHIYFYNTFDSELIQN